MRGTVQLQTQRTGEKKSTMPLLATCQPEVARSRT